MLTREITCFSSGSSSVQWVDLRAFSLRFNSVDACTPGCTFLIYCLKWKVVSVLGNFCCSYRSLINCVTDKFRPQTSEYHVVILCVQPIWLKDITSQTGSAPAAGSPHTLTDRDHGIAFATPFALRDVGPISWNSPLPNYFMCTTISNSYTIFVDFES